MKTLPIKFIFIIVIAVGAMALMGNACEAKSEPGVENQSHSISTPPVQVDSVLVDEPKSLTETPNATEMEPQIEPVAEKTEKSESSLQVVDLTVTSGISERVPIDSLNDIELGLGKIYTHTAVASDYPDTIVHVYFFQDMELARVPLQVGASQHWRTWSSKNLYHSWVGPWEVQIQNLDGTVLARHNFEVTDRSGKVIADEQIKVNK